MRVLGSKFAVAVPYARLVSFGLNHVVYAERGVRHLIEKTGAPIDL